MLLKGVGVALLKSNLELQRVRIRGWALELPSFETSVKSVHEGGMAYLQAR